MKPILAAAVSVVCVSAVCGSGVNAASTKSAAERPVKGGAKGAVAAKPSPAPAAAPFAPLFWEAGRPLTIYAPNDPEKVFAWLGARITAVPGMPDKFSPPEQEATYQAALANAMSEIGAIPLPVKCWSKKYDAAKQECAIGAVMFTVPKEVVLPTAAFKMNYRTVQIKRVVLKTETLVAQNAYGAKFDIEKTSERTINLLFPGMPGYEPDSALMEPGKERQYFDELARPGRGAQMAEATYMFKMTQYQVPVPMASADARDADEDIGCMYVMTVSAPFIRSDEQLLTATRDRPRESFESRHYIHGKLDRYIAYNKKTGQIYANVARTGL